MAACATPARHAILPSELGDRPAYIPDRRDYAAFRAAHPEVLEPNYLPFMLHRFAAPNGDGDWLVLCRWPDESMPIPVHIAPPEIPEELQNEFHPIPSAVYVNRVASALADWETQLEGLVRFNRVSDPAQAKLRVRVLGEQAPAKGDEIQMLGHTRSLLEACVATDVVGDRLVVDFEVPELVIYVADRSGMLTPNQVERVALHELGHALGMMGHTPIPTDFMYQVVRDRPGVSGLSTEDVNSFLSLYRVPNGTRFARIERETLRARPSTAPPSGPPALSLGPHVDARHGFEIFVPLGWTRVQTERGLFTANGPVWDLDASMEVVFWPYDSIDEFLGRYGRALFSDTWLRWRARIAVYGRPAVVVAVENAEGTRDREFTFVELGDGRIMMILSECPSEIRAEWRPWFQAALASLEIWAEPLSAPNSP